MADELGELIVKLYRTGEHSSAAKPLWKRVQAILAERGVEAKRADTILRKKDVDALAHLLGDLALGLAGGKTAVKTDPVPTIPEPTTNEASDTTDLKQAEQDRALLKRAMKAFRKRVKLTNLDEVSKLGHGPMSSGRRSDIVAIQPPDGYGKEVWEQLVKEKRLVSAGNGFYRLPESG